MRGRQREALRALDRRLQQPHRPQLDDAAQRWPGESDRYADQNAWMAGRIDASGWRARATSRPGSTGSTIGTEPTHTRRYSASTLPTSNAGSPRPASSQSTSSTRVRRRAPGAGSARQFSQRRSACTTPRSPFDAAQLPQPLTDELARLDAGQEILGPRAEIEHELVRRLGKLEAPDRGVRRDPRAARATPPACGRGCGPECARSAPDGRSSRARRPACAARGRPVLLEMHDLRHVPRQLRHAGQQPQHGCLMRQRRPVARRRLLDHERRPRPRPGEEHAVASRGVDDREVLVDDRPRLDNAEREEIVGNV